MKNKILPIIFTLLLIITLSTNFVLYNKLLKEKVNNNEYQEAMSQLVIMRNELNTVNDTIVSLQDDINTVENSIPASISNDEIVAEVLETLSTRSLNEQQTVETNDNNSNTSNTTTNNNGNTSNKTNTQSQNQSQQPDWSYFEGEGFGDIPTVKPDNEFGYDDGIHHGGIAQ